MSNNEEQNDLVQDWIDRPALNSIQMSEVRPAHKAVTSTAFRDLAGLQSR